MSGLLPKVSIKDVPENKADKLRVIAIVGDIKQKEVSNGYISLEIPLTFEDEKSGNERTFTARYNVRPEWFEVDFAASIPELEDNERISYQINMQKLTRGLFNAAGMEDMDFDAIVGERVGFNAGPRKDDPSRLQIVSFYKPKE